VTGYVVNHVGIVRLQCLGHLYSPYVALDLFWHSLAACFHSKASHCNVFIANFDALRSKTKKN